MAQVWIPPLLRDLTGGQECATVAGTNVRELIDNLELVYPGLRQRLCRDEELRPGMAVVVDGSLARLGMLEAVQPASEVHFVPAIAGG